MANQNQKAVSVLSYLLIGIIWYFLDKSVQDKTTKFHVKQGLNLLIFSFALMFIVNIVGGILVFITFGLFIFILIFLNWIFHIFFIILMIIGIVNSVNGKKSQVPIIGKYAEKYLTF